MVYTCNKERIQNGCSMAQTIGHYTLLTDIVLLRVNRESFLFKSDGKLFQETALL